MSKKDRDKNRDKRKFQGDQLQKRIKKGQEKNQFKIKVIKPDVKVENVFLPSYDQHTIDIVPYHAGKNDPTVEEGNETYTFEYEVHRYVGESNKWYICPKMYDKKCPICEYRDKLRAKDDEDYKKYFSKTRNLYNVVCQDDKKERKKGVQIWDVPYFYFEKNLMAISKRPSRQGKEERTVNFAHPVNGKSIVFTREKPKSEDDFDKYIGHAFDDREYEIDDELLDAAYQLDEIVYLASYDEIKKEFFGKDGKPIDNSKKENKGDTDMALDFDELFDDLKDCEDNDDLQEFLTDNDIDEDDAGFDEDAKFKKNMKAIKAHLEELQSSGGSSDDKDDEVDLDDMDKKALKKFAKEKGFKIDGMAKMDEDDLRDAIEELINDNASDDDKDSGKKKPKYTKDDLEEMSFKKLCKLVETEKLNDDIDVEDFDKDEKDDLIEEICEALGIEDE